MIVNAGNWFKCMRNHAPRRNKMDLLIGAINQGKHPTALKNIDYIKRRVSLVKELKIKYELEEKEKFLQVTVAEEDKYLIWIVVKRRNTIARRSMSKRQGSRR